MRIQYMSDLHFEFRENSRYIKQNRFPVTESDGLETAITNYNHLE